MNKAMILKDLIGVAWFSGSLKISLCEDRRFQDCLVLMTANLATSQKTEDLNI